MASIANKHEQMNHFDSPKHPDTFYTVTLRFVINPKIKADILVRKSPNKSANRSHQYYRDGPAAVRERGGRDTFHVWDGRCEGLCDRRDTRIPR